MREMKVFARSLTTVLVGCFLSFVSVGGFAQDVSPSGAFTYSYPLDLPPGTGGMGPSLSLDYNSMGGNGFLGMGFSLGGLSAITRDSSYGVTFDDGVDHFLYNGQKLVRDGSVAGLFHTQRESYLKISFVNPGTTGSFWKVRSLDGITRFYGATADSRVDAVGKGGMPRLWALSRVEDVLGNYYEVSYSEDLANGDYYPVKIVYTKNDAAPLSKYRTVLFSYEARTDHGPKYIPSLVDIDQRLKWVTVMGGTLADGSGGVLLRKYRIDYQEGASTGRSRVTAIQEYGEDGISTLPPVGLEWQEGGDGTFIDRNLSTTSGITDSSWTYYSVAGQGDFNGDGLSDLYLMAVDVYGRSTGGVNDHVWLSKGDGTFQDIGLGTTSGIRDSSWASYSVAGQGDFNGDGLSDLYLMAVDVYGRSTGGVNDHVWLSKGDGTFQDIGLGTTSGITDSSWTYYSVAGRGDFNGDGLSDLYLMAVDGYGHSTGGVNDHVWLSKGDGTFQDIGLGTASGIYDSTWAGYSVKGQGDFNGDGLSDLYLMAVDVYGRSTGGVNDHVWFSKGDGTFQDIGLGTASGITGGDWATCKVKGQGDFNGDGLSDLYLMAVDVYGRSTGNSNDHVWLEKGPFPDLLSNIPTSYSGSVNTTYKPAPQHTGAVVPVVNSYPNIANKSPRNLVTSLTVDDGMTHQYTTSYEYTNGKFHTGFPQERYSLGFETVKKTLPDGQYTITHYDQTDQYRAGLPKKIEHHGMDQGVDKLYSVRSFQYGEYAVPDAPGVKFIYRTNQYTYNYNGQTTADPVTYRTQFPSYNFTYGKPTVVRNFGEVDFATKADIKYDAVETRYHYAYSAAYNVLKPAKVVSVSYDLANGWWYGATTELFYDNQTVTGVVGKGLLTRVGKAVRYLSATEYESVYNEFAYDAYGNILKTWDSRAVAGEYGATPGPTTSYTYDTDYHTLLKTAVNALGHTETYSYANFRPTSTLDANGRTWYVVYDQFGRVVKKVAPGDTGPDPTIMIEYHLNNATPPQWIKTTAKDGTADRLAGYTYYDGLGRVIQKKTEAEVAGVAGWITTDAFYDGAGRNDKNSVPYFTNLIDDPARSAPDLTQPTVKVEYDPVSRVIKTINTDGTSTQTIYGLRETFSVDANGHVTSVEQDGTKTIQKSYGGTYTGGYSAYSRVTTIQRRNGVAIWDNTSLEANVIRAYVDLLGRKTSYKDPDMGTWTYTYDAGSNLKTQTDAKGQVISLSYDKLGRITQKDYLADADEFYSYDEAGHGYSTGRLTRITRGAWAESYVYDARGRVTSKTVTIDGISRSEALTYDQAGRVAAMTYPDGEVVNHTYNNGGQLKTLQGASSYVGNLTYNALNQVTALAYGNGITSYYDYYDSGSEYDPSAGTYNSYRLRKIYTSNTAIYNVQYQYDKAGNVKQKTDLNNSSYSESYGYDALNRLTSASSGVYGNKSYNYDALGNILSKDGQNYSYDITKPHAVTAKGQELYSYDANGNMREKALLNQAFLEVGKVTLNNTIDAGVSATVRFQKTYTNPVVVAYIMTRNGGESVDVRVKDVTATGCTLFTEEPDDQAHNPEEVGYMVMEAGSYQLPGGVKVEAGTVSTGSVHREATAFGGEQISFQSAFSAAPVVLHTLNSYNNRSFMTTVSPSVSATGFTLQQEAQGSGSPAAVETIGWIALESGVTGVVNSLSYETGRAQDGSNDGLDDTPHLISYASSFSAVPIVLVDGSTGNGTDGYWARGSGTHSATTHGVYAEEDKVSDPEANHADEGFGWFAIAGATVITLTAPPNTPIRGYTYDQANRLISITALGTTIAQYSYGASEARIKKVENGITTRYFFANYQEEFDGTSTNVIKYYARYAQRTTKEGLVYIHTDHLGSSTRLTSTTGAVLKSMGYTPYGSEAYSTGVASVSHRFTGQELDGTGLYYYGARYYDPELGRFTQPDIFLDSLNRYAYVHNNPIRYVDPTGHYSISDWLNEDGTPTGGPGKGGGSNNDSTGSDLPTDPDDGESVADEQGNTYKYFGDTKTGGWYVHRQEFNENNNSYWWPYTPPDPGDWSDVGANTGGDGGSIDGTEDGTGGGGGKGDKGKKTVTFRSEKEKDSKKRTSNDVGAKELIYSYYQKYVGVGAAVVLAAKVEVGYVRDTEGNRGVAFTVAGGAGVEADIKLPVKQIINAIVGNISPATTPIKRRGTIKEAFGGPGQFADAGFIFGLTQNIKTREIESYSVGLQVGGGAYWGYTFIFQF